MFIFWEMILRCLKCDVLMEVNKCKVEVGMVEDVEFYV